MDQQYEYRAEYLRALAHPVRLQILDLLREGEMCVCRIAAALNKEQAYVSGQLSVLRGSMLVDCHRIGRKAYYRLADRLLPEILSLIFGPPKLSGAEHITPPLTSRPASGSRPALNVKIVGAGCPHCKRLEAETRAVLDAGGIVYEMKIIHGADIVSYGLMSIPALVINERVVSCGRIPPRARIEEWVRECANTAD